MFSPLSELMDWRGALAPLVRPPVMRPQPPRVPTPVAPVPVIPTSRPGTIARRGIAGALSGLGPQTTPNWGGGAQWSRFGRPLSPGWWL